MLTELLAIISNAVLGNIHWIWRNIIFDVPLSQNYFWFLTIASFVVWGLECLFPWRKEQAIFRHDFWLDALYMYCNFFVFSIAINCLYTVIGYAAYLNGIQANAIALVDLHSLPAFIQLLIFFVMLDFLQWITHRCLHRFDVLWRFHQIHHQIKEMGFAGHLRYHWMENILYKPLKTLGIMLLGGFEPEQAFLVHFFTIVIGHLNHANIKLEYGVGKYVFNNPVMHLYHHAHTLPDKFRYGVNFGLTLSIWDYLFKNSLCAGESRKNSVRICW